MAADKQVLPNIILVRYYWSRNSLELFHYVISDGFSPTHLPLWCTGACNYQCRNHLCCSISILPKALKHYEAKIWLIIIIMVCIYLYENQSSILFHLKTAITTQNTIALIGAHSLPVYQCESRDLWNTCSSIMIDLLCSHVYIIVWPHTTILLHPFSIEVTGSNPFSCSP